MNCSLLQSKKKQNLMGKYAKKMSSELVDTYPLMSCIFWTPSFKINLARWHISEKCSRNAS